MLRARHSATTRRRRLHRLDDALRLLKRTVLFNELLNSQIASSHSNDDAAFLNFDEQSALSVLVHAIVLSDEKHAQPSLPRTSVDEVGQMPVDRIVLDRVVHKGHLLELSEVLVHLVQLSFSQLNGLHLADLLVESSFQLFLAVFEMLL